MEETAALVCLILALGYLKMPAGREPAEMQVLAGWQQREGFLQVEKGLTEDRHQLESPVRVGGEGRRSEKGNIVSSKTTWREMMT